MVGRDQCASSTSDDASEMQQALAGRARVVRNGKKRWKANILTHSTAALLGVSVFPVSKTLLEQDCGSLHTHTHTHTHTSYAGFMPVQGGYANISIGCN